jgi:hypothetical protein
MADTVLAVPVVPGSSQGNVDVAQVTNPTLNSTVLRENIVVGDPINFVGQAQATNARGLMVDNQLKDIMLEMLIELRTITQMLVQGLSIQDDPELIRSDPSLLSRLQQ